MAYKNKADQQKYFKNWYEENKEHFKKQVAVLNKKKRIELRQMIFDYKASKGCNRCPENDARCLDFHHIGDDKEFTIGNILRNKLCWESILKEIEKCEVICANCHRKEHY